MPLETVRISIDDTAYTPIGINVTAITATEYRVGSIRAVVQPSGATAPTVGATDYVEWDGSFTYSDGSADIYMLSPLGQAWLGVIRT